MRPAHASYRNLTFSPDGNYLYFLKAASNTGDPYNRFRAPVLGGGPQISVRDDVSGARFSPDGKRMAFVRANDPELGKFLVLTANSDGTNETTVANGPRGFFPNL